MLLGLDWHFGREIARVEAAGQLPWAVGGVADRPLLQSEAAEGSTGAGGGSETIDPDEVRERAQRQVQDVASTVGELARGSDLVTDGSVWVDPESSGRPWSDLGTIDGLLTFRGNPTRSFHGTGPVPVSPSVLWSVEIGCSNSTVGSEDKVWCGSGWTGQPVVFPAAGRGVWWLAFGGYNRSVNFLAPATGDTVYPAYVTEDIIKGTVTIDPDGYPLLYTGSRDDYFHVVALDRELPEALWKLSAEAVQPTLWNNDWDGSALVIDDYLFEGGENGRFFIVKLNRGFGDDGFVTVDPEIVFSTESWDEELLDDIGDRQVSVENSVAISGDVVYFANSGGLVQGWDISGLGDGETPERVFRFWNGDDTDATIVADSDGMLYVASEYERGTARADEVGQIMKLDPGRPDDPLVWSVEAKAGTDSGVWATPAVHDGVVIVPTNEGQVLGLDAENGAELWRLELPGPLWSSPVVVDGMLIQGDCSGVLHGFDVARPRLMPVEVWSVELEGCIESTPAVWGGGIFVGTRSGRFYAIADPVPGP
jgi:outer membrane protein assembly factor BamB